MLIDKADFTVTLNTTFPIGCGLNKAELSLATNCGRMREKEIRVSREMID